MPHSIVTRVVVRVETMQDAGNVLAGIEYLRFIDGEKRLIVVTEEGFAWSFDRVRVMTDTRVTVAFASAPREVRAVVYDPAVDLVGTAIWRLR